MTIDPTAIQEIPLVQGSQTLVTQLGALQYRLAVSWNPALAAYVLDAATTSGAPLVSGIPLVSGCDLLEQFAYLGIGGGLLAFVDGDAPAVPGYADLGAAGHLYYAPYP